MNRDQVAHPDWCGRSHVCTMPAPTGQHRSHPVTWQCPTGRLVFTRVQTASGGNRLEVRAVLDLPADPHTARRRAETAVWRLLQAISNSGGQR